MKKKIIATSWHPGGVNAILPVIKILNKEGKVDVVTIAHQYSEKILDEKGINYKTINDYGLSDVSVKSMERLLQEESPDLVLTGTSAQDENNRDTIEQTITLAAKRSGIISLAVLDFWGNYSLRFKDIHTGKSFKFLPDKVAIMDKFAEKDMLKEGFDKERLVITGNPHFDNLEIRARKFTDKEKHILREQIGLNSDLQVFYAANAFKKEKDNLGYWDLNNICLINEVLGKLPEEQKNRTSLVVKLHPRVPADDLEEISQYINQHSGGRIKLVTNISSQELVLASDITLISFSTVGIEAVYMRKPCISIQPGLKGEDYLAILTQNGLIPVGYNIDDCKSLVKRAIVDKKYRKGELVDKALSFRTDGKATERVTNLVYKMSE